MSRKMECSEKQCGTCRFHEEDADGWICTNEDSDASGWYTDYEDYCNEYEKYEQN